jgi:1-acyl-sn-glycerol-3-phosphate acyltransferase
MVIALANILCGVRYTVLGTENLPDAPVILLSKHQSAWETLAYLIIMPRPLVFVFKKELHYIPFFGWGLALLRMIPIDRSDGRNAFSKVVEQGRKRLAGGQWIIMFPEGHRIPVGKRGHYKSGGARLAIETKTPVVPIAIDSGHCWPKKAFILRPGLITVSIGKPISSDGKTPQQLINEVENWIENEMHHISPNDYASDVLSS